MNFEKLPEPSPLPRRTRLRRWPWAVPAVLLAAGGLWAGWWKYRSGAPSVAASVVSPVSAEAPPPAANEALHQTTQTAPILSEAAALDAQAAVHLQRRELYQAQKRIAEAWEKLEAAVARAPLAAGVDEAMRLRLAFLNRRHADLARVQELAHEAMTPEGDGTLSLETGTENELYHRVMGAGGAGSLEAAEEFCRRLGWMLGRRVRPAERKADGGAIRAIMEIETRAD